MTHGWTPPAACTGLGGRRQRAGSLRAARGPALPWQLESVHVRCAPARVAPSVQAASPRGEAPGGPVSGERLRQTLLSPAPWPGAPGPGEAEVRGGPPLQRRPVPLSPVSPYLWPRDHLPLKALAGWPGGRTMVTTLKALRRLEWQVGPIGQSQVRTLKTKSVLRMLYPLFSS